MPSPNATPEPLPSVAVLLLNWNGHRDTIECLESLYRLDYPKDRLTVVLCDNASTDGSPEKVRRWAGGDRPPLVDIPEALLPLYSSPLTEPIAVVEYSRQDAERGGNVDEGNARLVLIHTGDNLGFAGGNNVGLRYLHARNDRDLVWILNNDIDVAPDSLRKLVDAVQADRSLGAVSATLYEYREADQIQSAGGGVVSAWYAGPRPVIIAGPELDYLSGGCMLAHLSATRATGLISEEYFMYGEDVDYSLRIREAGFGLRHVPEARVWHKGGAAVPHASPRHDYYIVRNHLYLMKKYYPASMPVVMAAIAGRFVLPKIIRRQWPRLASVRRAVRDFRSGTMGPLPAATGTTPKS